MLILKPLACVTRAVRVIVNPMAMSFVIFPIPFIYIAVCVDYSSLPVGLIFAPVAFV